MTAGDTSGDFVTIARIRRPWGRRGEVIAELLTDFPERLSELPQVWIGGREHRIEGSRLHQGAVVLKLAGVDDISSAEPFAGQLVQIPAAQRKELDPGEVYWDQLAGCRVVQNGAEIGIVRHLDPTVGTPVLVVDTPEGELLVPFAEEICRRVDVGAKVIEVALPEGLADLNR